MYPIVHDQPETRGRGPRFGAGFEGEISPVRGPCRVAGGAPGGHVFMPDLPRYCSPVSSSPLMVTSNSPTCGHSNSPRQRTRWCGACSAAVVPWQAEGLKIQTFEVLAAYPGLAAGPLPDPVLDRQAPDALEVPGVRGYEHGIQRERMGGDHLVEVSDRRARLA